MATKSLKRPMKSKKPAKSAKASKASAKSVKRVYFFGNGKAEGNASMKDLLGGKGANLADMTLVPLPVPPGFTITTDTCGDYNDAGGKFPAGLMDTVLNIGLSDVAVEGLAKLSNNPRFAYDSYRRLINMFGDTVMGVDHHH